MYRNVGLNLNYPSRWAEELQNLKGSDRQCMVLNGECSIVEKFLRIHLGHIYVLMMYIV